MKKVLGIMKFAKSAWVIVLLSLVIIFVGSGLYLHTEPEWTKKTFPDYYNQAVSAYSKGLPQKAAAQFSHVGSMSQDPELKSLAFYNLGTMLGKQVFNEQLPVQLRFQAAEKAIEILREAVDNDPGNEDAKYNLELLRNQQFDLFLEMLRERPTEGPPSQEQDYGTSEKEKGY